MKRLAHAIAAIALLAALAACGSSSNSGGPGADTLGDGSVQPDGVTKPDGATPDGTGPDGTGLDTLDVPPGELDGTLPDGAQPDGTLPDGTLPDVPEECAPYCGFLEPCQADDDCASGYCVPTDANQVCSKPCTDTCDQPGWACVEIKNSCPDCIYVCMFRALTLCSPCRTDADCATGDADLGARCVSYGPAGSFCGAPCGSAGDCPQGYACDDVPLPGGATSPQCVLQEGLCPCSARAVEKAASTDCQVQNEFGQCPGERACAAGGLTACDGVTPKAEECNGADDDCDGQADEDVAVQPCSITNGFGTCPGEKSCDGGSWTCTGPTPAAETCNGKDDDCDGEVDNGFTDQDADDLADCVDPDDDNDGIPDDGDLSGTIGDAPCSDAQTTGCDDNCRIVSNASQADLDKDGKGDACECDIDGDGYLRDDNYLGEAAVCKGPDCDDLDPDRHPGIVEGPQADDACRWCNGIDDDCDGKTDEACADNDSDGSADCVDPDDDNDGVPDATDNCPFVSNQGQGNLDGDGQGDDCDDDADGDTIPNATDNCPFTANTDQADADGDGSGDACDGDKDGDKDPDETDCGPTDPAIHHDAAEVCNGKDDDCDGLTDAADDALVVVPCEYQQGVCQGCQKRADQCKYGEWLECLGVDYFAFSNENFEGEETYCDGLDNDCDGTTDENHRIYDWNGADRFLGDACGTGACAGGVVVCSPQKWTAICSTDALVATETCNGQDDDCDGTADDGFTFVNFNGAARKVGESCGTGACADGVVVCNAETDGTLCTTAALAAPETCDLVDDDCDGLTDAKDPDLATFDAPLCEKQAGVCQGAQKAPTLCVGGQWLACGETDYQLHDINYQHGTETGCDLVDNDCDGQVDEGFTYVDWNGQVKPLGAECGTGACAGGFVHCVDYVATECTRDHLASPEDCNGEDDDCDGLTDDGFTFTDWNGVPRLVGEGCGTGACAGGTVTCDAQANVAICTTSGGSAEVCNGVDDDCDGQTDEGFAFTDWNGQTRPLGAACGTGACANGKVVCGGGGDVAVCDTAGLVGPEVCNGTDDDCDGKLDANDPDLLTNDHPACENANGVCAGCSKPASLCAGGTWLSCGTAEYAACSASYEGGAEASCDGQDNNCSGAADEGFQVADWNSLARSIGQGCGTGACTGGTVVCNAAHSGAVCSTIALASPEACNGADDDCDGAFDEGFAVADWNGTPRSVGQSCGTGDCAGGTVTCNLGLNVAQCSTAGKSSQELCDGSDNDCDGNTDEGFSMTDWNGQVRYLGAGCGTGACAGGTVVCDPSMTSGTCDTWSNSGPEVCNGTDDDCDGKTDASDIDLLTNDRPYCELQSGVCVGLRKSASMCSGGTWLPCPASYYSSLSPLYQAGVETSCDSYDNDCDGSADEDFTNDVNNCGGCNKKCTNDFGSTLCNNGTCVPSCATGYKSCDGIASNGCERSIRTLSDCGDCGTTCDLPNSAESCSTGSCLVTSCSSGYCNGNGQPGDGCEVSLDQNPTCAGTVQNLGAIYGDNPGATAEAYDKGERWLRVNVQENYSSATERKRLSATVTLVPPAGTDYDLDVYCDNCTTSAGTSANGTGAAEVVNVRWDEGCTEVFGVCTGFPDGVDSSRDIYIRVRHFSANTCDQWHLTVAGNTNVSSNTCSQK